MGKIRFALLVALIVAGIGACSASDSTNVTDASLSDTEVADAAKGDASALDASDAACPMCNGVCTDTSKDPANCGGCGKSCGQGIACASGVCAVTCGVNEKGCPGLDGGAPYCAKTADDPNNCGGCGTSCGASATCVKGACVSCATKVCTNQCVDTTSDNKNCGNCGIGCNALSCCSSACTDITQDLMNCGGCGQGCIISHGVGACTSSMCAIKSCNPGFADCNLMVSDGCEINIYTDLNHCGGCNKACQFGSNSKPTCSAGMCGLSCAQGWADCDKNPSNGCEVNILTDKTNCGMCGKMCTNIQSCIQGICT